MRSHVRPAAAVAGLLFLTACGRHVGTVAELPVAVAGAAADTPQLLGAPFTIDGVSYSPADTLNYDALGYASLGAEGGEGVSAAHKTLPLPSYAEVTVLDSGKTVLVRLERRGPMDNDRLIELSPGAARQLGLANREMAPVRVRRVSPSETERVLLRNGGEAAERMNTPAPLLVALMRKLDEQTLAATAAPTPAPTPTADATDAPQAPTPQAEAAQRGPSFVVQAGAFSTRERAQAVAIRLGAALAWNGRFFRVRNGPFVNRADAEAALAKVRAAGYSGARILRAE